MIRGWALVTLGVLSGTVAAQELPDYTKAEVVEAAQYCLELYREFEANAQQFSFQEFGMPVYSEEVIVNTFTACVLYRLENRGAEIVPLA